MPKELKKAPKFKDLKEEALFWDTHDATDYLELKEPLEVVYSPDKEKKETISLRMAPSLKKKVDRIADSYDISTSSLIRMWVVDKVRSFE